MTVDVRRDHFVRIKLIERLFVSNIDANYDLIGQMTIDLSQTHTDTQHTRFAEQSLLCSTFCIGDFFQIAHDLYLRIE
ncbi:hypothetical protein D3C87_1844480 [compost metagenome]